MQMPMNDKREQLRTEMLEAALQRAAMREAYSKGIEAPFKDRCALDARIANLTLELHKYNIAERAEKKRAKDLHKMQTHAILVDKLIAAGLSGIVDAARQESLKQLEAAGLRDAYQS